ncbi:MAG TPA: zf-HC2 domain-containing protein [Candidatus Methylomirabilis sp.]|jgi:anti-sigma factor RsiW|nr:zf-HC2 domain-containing protein [Candidatus Methylomirabilis sp.]
MICGDVIRDLETYLDGELPVRETLQVAEHLASCPSCAAREEQARAARAHLRLTAPRPEVPPALRERITAALDRIDRRALRASQLAGRRPLWLATAAAAAAAVLFAVWIGRSAGPAPLALELVAQHMSVARLPEPVEFASSDAGAVAGWFQGRAPYRVSVPDYSRTGIRLLGGRITDLSDRRAAFIVYEKNRRTISLFTFPHYGEDLDRATAVKRDGRTFYTQEVRGYQLLLWQERGMAYALVADLGWDELFQCAEGLLQILRYS